MLDILETTRRCWHAAALKFWRKNIHGVCHVHEYGVVWNECGVVCLSVVYRSERGHIVTLTDKEFDDILQRNKNVSSGAIMRAVQDASEGLAPLAI